MHSNDFTIYKMTLKVFTFTIHYIYIKCVAICYNHFAKMKIVYCSRLCMCSEPEFNLLLAYNIGLFYDQISASQLLHGGHISTKVHNKSIYTEIVKAITN